MFRKKTKDVLDCNIDNINYAVMYCNTNHLCTKYASSLRIPNVFFLMVTLYFEIKVACIS